MAATHANALSIFLERVRLGWKPATQRLTVEAETPNISAVFDTHGFIALI